MKTCFHSHFYANFCEINATNILQLHTANFSLFKMAVQYQFFPILMVQLFFPQIQQAPGPDFRTVGKSLLSALDFYCLI